MTVVSPADPDGSELLLDPDGHPAAEPFKDARVADGIPFTSFAVDDVKEEFDRPRALGVRFTQEPLDAGPVTTAVLDDACGVERGAGLAGVPVLEPGGGALERLAERREHGLAGTAGVQRRVGPDRQRADGQRGGAADQPLDDAVDGEAVAGGGVERSEVSPLVNLLFYVPGEWAKRLEEGRHLLETLPSSGLRKRSQVMPQRYRHLKQYLGPVLQEVSQPEELRFLLGWLMRCLYVRGRNGGG